MVFSICFSLSFSFNSQLFTHNTTAFYFRSSLLTPKHFNTRSTALAFVAKLTKLTALARFDTTLQHFKPSTALLRSSSPGQCILFEISSCCAQLPPHNSYDDRQHRYQHTHAAHLFRPFTHAQPHPPLHTFAGAPSARRLPHRYIQGHRRPRFFLPSNHVVRRPDTQLQRWSVFVFLFVCFVCSVVLF